MDVQLAAICDSANLSQEGKLNILGEFNTIYAPSVPAMHPFMVFVAKLLVSHADGEDVELELRIVSGQGDLVAPALRLRGRGQLPKDGSPGTMTVIVPIVMATFKEHGEYEFELRSGGQQLRTVQLSVRPVESAE